MRAFSLLLAGAVMAIGVSTGVAIAPMAHASVALDGFFVAQRNCEAFQSKNERTNPGDVRVEPPRAYDVLEINQPGGDFYRMVVPGAPVIEERWVHASCGVHVVEAGGRADPVDMVLIAPPPGAESEDNLLALSWQPAFCETRPTTVECRDLNAGLLPITETQLSIHGLWPQPRGNDYCGVPDAVIAIDEARNWGALPELGLDREIREVLDVAMPGSASHLDRHEWIKHGTCFKGEGGPDEYFADTLEVTNAINESVVGRFLAAYVGAAVETDEIRARFDEAFGAGAGARVQVTCVNDGGRRLVQELRISLVGRIHADASVAELIRAADEVAPGCGGGVIDPAGLQ